MYVGGNFEDYGGSSAFARGLNSEVNIIIKGEYITNIGALVGGNNSKTCVVVHGDYIHKGIPFSEPSVLGGSVLYVMGNIKVVNVLDNTMTTLDQYSKGYKFGTSDLDCPIDFPDVDNNPEPSLNKYNWGVEPEVNAEYK